MSLGRTEVFRTGSGLASAQPELWVASWEDRLRDCPLVLALPELAESLLGEKLRSLYGNGGGVPFDPVSLFCVWLYGYLEGERSSRRLERLCKYDIRYEYLSRSCNPDYSTLCRFRKRLSSILDSLFLEVVEACSEVGLVSCKTVAIDGTKIMARKTQWRKALDESERSDEFESEAKTMLTTHGEYLIGYNVQAVADTENSIVVGYVATNTVNDQKQLPVVLNATKRLSGMHPETAVMDKGYDSGDNATSAAQNGVTAIIPPIKRGKRPFSKDEHGVLRCLAGHEPTRSTWIGREQVYDHFRVSKCANCELREPCGATRKQRAMKVKVGTDVKDKADANALAQTTEGQELLRLRGPTIERRFAFLKREQGLRRFLLTGLAGAELESGLAFIAQNMKTLMRAILSFIFAIFKQMNAQKPKTNHACPCKI